MSAGYFMHGQTMGGLLSAAASAGSVGGGAGNIAGPAMAEDCELGRMYPTPPSCSTQVRCCCCCFEFFIVTMAHGQ